MALAVLCCYRCCKRKSISLAEQSSYVERKVSSASSDSGLGLEVTEAEAEQDPEETDKRVITPDDVAVRELLNFDEVRSEE